MKKVYVVLAGWDYGETSAAYSAVAELENQIKSLKWVIEG